MNLEKNSQPLLPEDFAERVIARVDHIRHRRKMIRRGSAAASACGLALAVALLTRPAPLTPVTEQAAAQSDSNATTASLDAEQSEQQPMSLFFPDADPVVSFATYYSEAGWHSYDSWWNSSS